MFQINSLIFKYKKKDNNGNSVIDLTRSSIGDMSGIALHDVMMVTKDYEMRPDLIAEQYYGIDDKFDLILKFNGISNPFSIYEGQELAIPDFDKMNKAFRMPIDIVEPNYNGSYADFIIPTKNNKDKKRLDALRKKAENNVLPPNINDECENNVTITNDKIILGSCVSNTDPLCGGTTTRGRLKQKLIENKINNF